jgi:Tfp pilus assembly protein PilF
MSEDLTTSLSNVDGLGVAARTSAFSFKGQNVDVREIAKRLQVGYVLEGSVQRAGTQLRVTAQLINAATGLHVWANNYERAAQDVFRVQDDIVRAIIGELQMRLSGTATASLAKRSTVSIEAHDAYLQGRYFFDKRDSSSLRKARQYFERAIQIDSSYAPAYAGLSDGYSHGSVFGYLSSRDAFPRAKSAVQTALGLDSLLAEAHTSQGFISVFYDWDWPAARTALDRALALDPRSSYAHLYHAWYFLATGAIDDALGEARVAVKLDPFSLITNARLATMLYYARRYQDALTQGRRAPRARPEIFPGTRRDRARPPSDGEMLGGNYVARGSIGISSGEFSGLFGIRLRSLRTPRQGARRNRSATPTGCHGRVRAALCHRGDSGWPRGQEPCLRRAR